MEGLSVFTADFDKTTISKVARTVTADGYFFHPGALDEGFIALMLEQFGPNRAPINHNGLSTVCFGRQFFLNQVLGQSKAAYDLITSDRLLDIAEAILGKNIRLTAKRYYTTREGHQMQWHRDNKSAPNQTLPLNGIIIIFYLTDVTEGAFQVVRGSDRLDLDRVDADFPADHVESNYGDRIATLPGKKGACVIYKLQMIHRAKPFVGLDYDRSSLFISIVAEPTVAEALLVNTSFLDNLNHRRRFFLGFGKRDVVPVFPHTDVTTMDDQMTRSVFAAVQAYKQKIGI